MLATIFFFDIAPFKIYCIHYTLLFCRIFVVFFFSLILFSYVVVYSCSILVLGGLCWICLEWHVCLFSLFVHYLWSPWICHQSVNFANLGLCSCFDMNFVLIHLLILHVYCLRLFICLGELHLVWSDVVACITMFYSCTMGLQSTISTLYGYFRPRGILGSSFRVALLFVTLPCLSFKDLSFSSLWS